jgi:DNA-binding MarR family transcriptional regulator
VRRDEFVLEEFLPYRLSVLAHQVSRSLAEVYGERYGLTIAQWRIIANLGRAGAMTAGVLAERSNLDKPKVTRALKSLIARGLVSRTAVKGDRRRASIALTARGRTVFRAVGRLALAWERELCASLDPVAMRCFDGAVDELTARARHLAARHETEPGS